MKRVIFFYVAIALMILSSAQTLSAQDDVYYDPNKDPGLQQNNDAPEQPVVPAADKTDGYGNPSDNPAYQYDEAESSSDQQNGNSYVTNNYYEDDDDNAYYYTNRLRRYYSPNWGVNYYSYWFTPSYYYGWNNWNTSVTISLGSPWYQDPWWRWNNRHHSTVVIYDPWYDPYWSYNWGWSSCNYYNTWSNPYYGNSCSYSSWGYNGWGYNNGGFCGGYYNGYNYGYWNGYNNGYYDGYYNGYNNGWNQAYGNGNYYHGPRHRNTVPDQPGNNPVNNKPVTRPVVDHNPAGQQNGGVNIHNSDIPKEGIQRPINSNTQPAVIRPDAGVIINTEKPAKPGNTGVVKPGMDLNNANGNRNNTDKWSDKNQTLPKGNNNVQPSLNNNGTINNNNTINGGRYTEPKVIETRPVPNQPVQPKPNTDWNKPAPDYRDNYQPQRPEVKPQPRQEFNNQPNVQPRQNVTPEQPRNIYNQQPRQEVKPIEQPRNFSPQPKQENRNFEQPKSNYSSPRQQEQRSVSPGNNQGGGMKRKF